MPLSKRLSVRGKLLLMLVPPMAGYAFFNLDDSWSSYQELNSKGLIQKGIDLAQPLWRAFFFDLAASFVVWMVTLFVVYRVSTNIQGLAAMILEVGAAADEQARTSAEVARVAADQNQQVGQFRV